MEQKNICNHLIRLDLKKIINRSPILDKIYRPETDTDSGRNVAQLQ